MRAFDDDEAELAHRRTLADLEGSEAAFLGMATTAHSRSGHGHLDASDSGEGEVMYEPYAGYNHPPSAFSPFAGAVSRQAPDYAPARTQSASPGPPAGARPISPGYTALAMHKASSSIGHSSSSGHENLSSMGHALNNYPYVPARTGSPALESPGTSEQHEPLMGPSTVVTPPQRAMSPPLPPKNPNRPRAMKIEMPQTVLTAPKRGDTGDSEYPPSYPASAYSHEVPSEDMRLDPNLASRLRGGGMLSGSTPSFRDDQDYSRRITMVEYCFGPGARLIADNSPQIRQNTYDSYASMPSDIRETDEP